MKTKKNNVEWEEVCSVERDESYVAQLPHALIIILLMIIAQCEKDWNAMKIFFDVSEYQSAY